VLWSSNAPRRDLALTLALTSNVIAVGALGVSAYTIWRTYGDCRPVVSDTADPAVAGRGDASTPSSPGAAPEEAMADDGPDGVVVDPSEPDVGDVREDELSEADLALFMGSPEDPAPNVLGGVREENYDRHYWSSDEWNLHLFTEHIDGLGGGYVGVGADQAYLMIGWMDPELAWVMDYDPMIVELHGVYADFFAECESPAQLMHLWSRDGKQEARELLQRRRADPEEFERAFKVYQRAMGRAKRRLDMLHDKHVRGNIKSYLTDQVQFDRVREALASGRVRHMQVDLTGGRGLAGIAAVANELGVPIRVLYLSNAEQYWPYGDQFRENIEALPFDDSSVILRTIASHDTNQDYRYNLQSGRDFQERIGDPEIKRSYHFVDLRPLKGPDDVAFTITTVPRDVTRERLAAFESRKAADCEDAPDGMACIPGGAFLRGMDDGPPYARPAEAVWLETFYMDTHEVTYAEYQACAERGDCPKARPRYADFNHPRQPMNGVSWYDADAYCRQAGKHLPTEAQWEKAARGTDGRLYPWGNEKATCERAVIKDRGERSCGVAKRFGKPEVGRPFEIGSKAPNQYGLYDMAGNAYEWVADWFAIDYEKCGDDCSGFDPLGPCAGDPECRRWPKKVVRGGSWYWPAHHATTVHRRAHDPDNEPFHHFGFRCAASLAEARSVVGDD